MNDIPIYFINGLEAAYGLFQLKTEDFNTIQEGTGKATGNIAVIAPGTSLGESAAWCDGKSRHPFATEGGHCDFAARTPTDFKLLDYFREKFGHVSWERLVSGPGIVNIFALLRTENELTIPGWLQEKMNNEGAEIAISLNAHRVEICNETIQ